MRAVKHGLQETASWIIKELLAEGFTIQRYDAASTGSIYLKLDYGVCNSIRISDHNGKDYLKYRYNIGPHIEKEHTEIDKYPRIYMPLSQAGQLAQRIVKDRKAKRKQYGAQNYQKYMEVNRKKNKDAKGFWAKAHLVTGGRCRCQGQEQ